MAAGFIGKLIIGGIMAMLVLIGIKSWRFKGKWEGKTIRDD